MAMDYAKKIEERLRAAFGEVMLRANELVDSALDDHFDDVQKIFLRDRTVSVSLGMTIGMNEAGQIEVDLTTGYVKERVKDKTSARVTPGQGKLPGMDDVSAAAPCNVGSHNHSDSPFYCGDGMEYCDVENRLMRVKEMGREQLRAVIALPSSQKQVVKAAEARLRKLEKEEAAVPRLCRTCEKNDVVNGCEEDECASYSHWTAKGKVA